MGSTRPGVPLDLAVRLKESLGLLGAVETGTLLGDSAVQLARCFPQVWTIELSPEFHEAAQNRHKNAANVRFLQGSSPAHLKAIAGSTSGPLLYWLDAHWSAGETAGEDFECPVIAEIDAIDGSTHAAESAILIDDARLFFGPPDPPHKREQWPTFMDIADHVRQRYARYVTALEDVIIAVPLEAQECVELYWLERDMRAQRQRASLGDRIRRRLTRDGN